MDKSTITNYVCEHAIISENVVDRPYSVNFATFSFTKTFFGSDIENLTENVWNFCQTDRGSKLMGEIDFSAYTDENYNSEDGE